MSLFGSSGIRRLADKELLVIALESGLALARDYGRVVVGCDTRTSSEAVKNALFAGVLAGGGKCFDAGMVPTPTLALAAAEFDAGAMITASHNPPEYNGIKMLSPDGAGFDTKLRQRMEELIGSESLGAARWHDMTPGISRYSGAVDEHICQVMSDFPGPLKVRVVLDCACGATCVITPYLLRRLGCEVLALNSYPTGVFPHPAEPTADNLADLMRATREFGADVGIAHDGDGDRMMAVDDKGRFIPGDKLMVMLARRMQARKLVTTLDASMIIDEMGMDVVRTRVGDIYVSEALRKGGDFGGEPSGAWIFPRKSLCPDGVYAAACLATLAGEQRLSELADAIPAYPVLRGSIAGNGLPADRLANIFKSMAPLSVSHLDGIKLNFAEGWLLIRASGTESKIRVTAEARSIDQARRLYDEAVRLVSRHGGEGGIT